MSDKQQIIIDDLILILKKVVDNVKNMHPRRNIYYLEESLSDFVSDRRCYDLMQSALQISLLRHLMDKYFDNKIATLASQELEKTSISPEIKNMIKRDFQSLNFDNHFDGDYVLQLDEFKDSMSSSKIIENIGSTEYEIQIIESIERATDKIIQELEEISIRIIKNSLKELEETGTLEAFNNNLLESVKEIYKEVHGWAI